MIKTMYYLFSNQAQEPLAFVEVADSGDPHSNAEVAYARFKDFFGWDPREISCLRCREHLVIMRMIPANMVFPLMRD